MHKVVIVSAVRTPIGQIRGALSSVRPDDLAALVIREAVSRANVDAAQIEEVYMGCANQAGEDNRNVARMGLLLAGLPHSVPVFCRSARCGHRELHRPPPIWTERQAAGNPGSAALPSTLPLAAFP